MDKDGNESVVAVLYKIKFIDSARFIATSLSNFVDNLKEGDHKIKYKDYDCFLEYKIGEDNLIKYNCLSCNKDYPNKINKELKTYSKKTFKFSNNDINEIVLLLRKGIYPFEYMDDWGMFHETASPKKEDFYSNLNMEDVAHADYMHGKRL